MLRFESEVAEVFDLLSADPTGLTVAQFQSLPSANQFRRLYAMTDQHVPQHSKVLDWGCGNGHFSFYLARRGYAVTAYAFEPEPAIFALLTPPERARITYVRASEDDPRTIPFADGSFDCVFSIGVLEHVRETGGTEADSLLQIRRVLRSDGVFICYHLPNRFSYIEALARFLRGPQDYTKTKVLKYHEWLFERRQIDKLCSDADFSLAAIARYGALPRNIFSRFPGALRRSRSLATAVNVIDALLEPLVRPVAQNYSFVARPRA
jgi:SAM-dependent methyltransferase